MSEILQACVSAGDDNGLAFPIFRRCPDLILGQFQRDAVARVVGGREVQHIPVHGDLAAADTHESAEIDDGGAGLAGLVDDDVDDAPHVFVGVAAHLTAQDALHVTGVEHNGRWCSDRSRLVLEVLVGTFRHRLSYQDDQQKKNVQQARPALLLSSIDKRHAWNPSALRHGNKG